MVFTGRDMGAADAGRSPVSLETRGRGLAQLGTVVACVTVTSSGTPRAPMMTPANSTPRMSTFPFMMDTYTVSTLANASQVRARDERGTQRAGEYQTRQAAEDCHGGVHDDPWVRQSTRNHGRGADDRNKQRRLATQDRCDDEER
jgi:hypothetical protein